MLRVVGAGAVADVYLARDLALGRDVALKVLRTESSANPEFVERFKREARAAASLNHSNIVAIHDWGDLPLPEPASSHLYFIVMEYVAGADLRQVLRERGSLPEEEALRIAIQAAAALDAAHRRGLIHRDVKPHNILLTADGSAKMTDFGIARVTGVTQLTSTNIVLGTAHYLSPEQARGRNVDARSDLYSLGAVLFELLTGKVPFTGETPLEVALQHVNTPAPSPRSLARHVSPATEKIVAKALKKDPGARFQTAEEMRLALISALERVRARPAMKPSRVASPVLHAAPRPTPSRGSSGAAVAGDRSTPWLLAAPLLIILLVAGTALMLARSGGSDHSAARQSTPHRGNAGAPAATALSRHTGMPAATASSANPGRPQPHPTTGASRQTPGNKPGAVHQTTPASQHPVTPGARRRTGTASHPTAVVAAPAPRPTSAVAAPYTPPVSNPAPVAAPPPTPAPTALVAAVSQPIARTPTAAVASFYTFVAHHEFDQAARLWSTNMVNTWGIQDGIVSRFSPTTRLAIKNMRLVSEGNGHAAVAVDLLEWRGNSSTPQELIGAWELVQGPSGWLLDAARF